MSFKNPKDKNNSSSAAKPVKHPQQNRQRLKPKAEEVGILTKNPKAKNLKGRGQDHQVNNRPQLTPDFNAVPQNRMQKFMRVRAIGSEKPVRSQSRRAGPTAQDRVIDIDYHAPDLSLATLRCVSRHSGQYGLIDMVTAGKFSGVVQIALNSSGDTLKTEDFTLSSDQGFTVLDYLANRGELELAFNPQLWAGRLKEMKALWKNCVSQTAKRESGLDFNNLAEQAQLLTAQKDLPTRNRLRRRPPSQK